MSGEEQNNDNFDWYGNTDKSGDKADNDRLDQDVNSDKSGDRDNNYTLDQAGYTYESAEKDNKDGNKVGNTDILVDMDYNDNLDGNADKLVDKETIMTSCNKMVLLYRL